MLSDQQILNPTPLNPTPATCHKRKRKLRCSSRNAALQKLHCNIGFSAVPKSFGPKAALQETKNCTATSKKLRCRKVALSCRFPAGFKPPRLGSHVSDLLKRDRIFLIVGPSGSIAVSPLADLTPSPNTRRMSLDPQKGNPSESLSEENWFLVLGRAERATAPKFPKKVK